jgi:hypothetical protein
MNSKKVIFAALAVFAVWLCITSCKSKKALVSNSDSVSMTSKQVVRDSAIKAPADSAKLSVPVNKVLQAISVSKLNKDTTVLLGSASSKQANAKATIKDGNLKVECMCDELELLAHIIDTYTSKAQVKTQTITLPPVQIKYIPWYITVLAWVGGISIVATLLTLLAAKFKSKTSV